MPDTISLDRATIFLRAVRDWRTKTPITPAQPEPVHQDALTAGFVEWAKAQGMSKHEIAEGFGVSEDTAWQMMNGAIMFDDLALGRLTRKYGPTAAQYVMAAATQRYPP